MGYNSSVKKLKNHISTFEKESKYYCLPEYLESTSDILLQTNSLIDKSNKRIKFFKKVFGISIAISSISSINYVNNNEGFIAAISSASIALASGIGLINPTNTLIEVKNILNNFYDKYGNEIDDKIHDGERIMKSKDKYENEYQDWINYYNIKYGKKDIYDINPLSVFLNMIEQNQNEDGLDGNMNNEKIDNIDDENNAGIDDENNRGMGE